MADPRCTRRRTRRRTSSRRPPRSRRGSLSLAAMIAAMITTMIAGVAPAPTSLSGVPGSGVLGPSRAQAAPPADPMVEARALYDRGAARFETADYAGAIELWTEAYAQVPNTPETAEVKILLLYNLATARERQFEVDGAPIHLRQALILLDGFLDSLDSLGRTPEESAAEREEAETRRAAIEARLAAAIPEPEPEPGPGPTPPPSDPTLTPGPVDSGPPPPSSPPGRGLITGGAVLLGLGGGALGLMTAGLVLGGAANDLGEIAPTDLEARREQFARGRLGNTLAIAGGALAGVSLAAGSALLLVGLRRNRAAGETTALAPLIGPGVAGLSLRGRF